MGSDSRYKCDTCIHLADDKAHPGWGWCKHGDNSVSVVIVMDEPVYKFKPSQSPTGSCLRHQMRMDEKQT